MKVVFFGTPAYVLPILNALNKSYKVVGVVTQPPKPVGREKLLTYSAVDTWAHKRKMPIYFDPKDVIDAHPDAELGVLAAYGLFVPEFVINHFKFGILNIHPSLLPQYRGASPTQTAILAGDTQTGITVIKLSRQLDAGPIVTQFKEDILPDDTNVTLRDRLFEKSVDILMECLPAYLAHKFEPKPQDEDKATTTSLISREDGLVDLKKDDPELIVRKLRAYTPWPGIWTMKDNQRMKILKCHVEDGKLVLDLIQFAGKLPTPLTN